MPQPLPSLPFGQSGRRGKRPRSSQAPNEAGGPAGSLAGGEADGEAEDLSSEASVFGEEQLHCAGIWLHALRYERRDPKDQGNDWSFETSLPEWAVEDFREPVKDMAKD